MKTTKVTGNHPVTQDEFDSVMTAVKQDLDDIRAMMATKDDLADVKSEVAEVKSEVASVKQLQETTLEIVKSIDVHLKPLRDLPHRVEKLESNVFQLKTRR